MAITLPAIPKEAEAHPRFLWAGRDAGGQQGGSIMRVNRLGSRYALDIRLPTLDEAAGRAWIAALLDSRTTGATLVAVIPQAPLAVGLGAPVVDGAGQAGTTLFIRSATPGVTIPRGRFFSFTAGGRFYPYATRTDVVVDGLGKAILQVAPKIRKAPADGAALDFVNAKIEGWMDGGEEAWSLILKTWMDGIAFTLKENK